MKKLNITYNSFLIIMSVFLSISCNNQNSMKAGYQGKDLTGQATIIRDKSTKQAILDINLSNEWKLYEGDTPEKINFKTPIAQGTGPGEYKLPESLHEHSFFELVTSEGQMILAEKHLPLEGAFNFRDLGGIRTKEGKYTRWGKVFRSDELNQLSNRDLDYLSSIPLITVVDFRSASEIEQAPDRTPTSVKETYVLNIIPGNLETGSVQEVISMPPEQGDSLMRNVNRQLVSDPNSYEQYKTFFRLLQNEENTPLVFHCTAGKDRTGYGAYLFLSALGVDEETIMKDYLSSNEYLKGKYGAYIKKYPGIKPLLEVREGYLGTAIEEIKNKYGNVENYLTQVLEVDLNKMKQLYLY